MHTWFDFDFNLIPILFNMMILFSFVYQFTFMIILEKPPWQIG